MFIEEVRAEVDRRGMPLSVLARRAQISRQTLYTMLSGRSVSEATLVNVARVLELDPPERIASTS